MWKKYLNKRNRVLLGIFFCALLWTTFQYFDKASKAQPLLSAPMSWQTVTLESVKWINQEQQELIFRTSNGVRLLNYFKASEHVDTLGETLFLRPGDKLRVFLRLSEATAPRNPGAFDEPYYYFSRNLQLKAQILEIARLPGTDHRFFISRLSFQLREKITEQFQSFLGQEEVAVALAVLMGEERLLSSETKKAFRASGLTHLLVVSAGNLSILLLLAASLIESGVPHFGWRLFLQMILAIFYGFLCNWDAFISRAVVMFIVRALSQYFERPLAARRNLVYAAFLILCLNPYFLLKLGFLMSFVCSFAILTYGKGIEAWTEKQLRRMFTSSYPSFWQRSFRKLFLYLGQALGITLVAQLAILPFNLYLSTPIGPFQWLLNLPAALLVSFITINLFIMLPILLIFPALTLLINSLIESTDMALKLLNNLAKWGEGAPMTSLADARACLLVFPAWTLALMDLCLTSAAKRLKQGLLLISLGLAVLILFFMRIMAPDYSVFFIDVGQGSAVLIKEAGGHAVLYDCGPSKAAKSIIALCHNQAVDEIDLLVISHMHEDHYGGFKALSDEIEIRAVLLPNKDEAKYASSTDLAVLEEIEIFCERKGIKSMVIGAKDKLLLATFELEFIPSSAKRMGLGNEASQVVNLHLGDERVMLLGDMEPGRWPMLSTTLKKQEPLLLQLPHHGAKDALPKDLSNLQAQVIIIQVGERNPYGHPHASVLESLKKRKFNVYRNDEDGCIIIKAYGQSWFLETYFSEKKQVLR